MFDSLQPHGLQYARLPCTSPSLRFAQTHVHWVGDAIQPSHSLLPSSPPAFNLSSIRVLFNESALHIRWPNSLLSLDYLDLKLDIGYGEGNGNPLQYPYLENPMDGGAWWAVVHGVAKSQTRLSDFPFTFHFHALEKEMATHSSVLAWRIPGTGESGGLPSMESHRVRQDWSNLAAIAAAYFLILFAMSFNLSLMISISSLMEYYG